MSVADQLHLPRRDAWKVQNQPERNELFAQHEVRISSGAPADALSLQRIYAKAPAILAHGPHPTCIFDSLTLDSSFLPPPLAEFTKFQNGIVVELQLHADAFASAKITSLPLLFADETTTHRLSCLLHCCLHNRHTRRRILVQEEML